MYGKLRVMPCVISWRIWAVYTSSHEDGSYLILPEYYETAPWAVDDIASKNCLSPNQESHGSLHRAGAESTSYPYSSSQNLLILSSNSSILLSPSTKLAPLVSLSMTLFTAAIGSPSTSANETLVVVHGSKTRASSDTLRKSLSPEDATLRCSIWP